MGEKWREALAGIDETGPRPGVWWDAVHRDPQLELPSRRRWAKNVALALAILIPAVAAASVWLARSAPPSTRRTSGVTFPRSQGVLPRGEITSIEDAEAKAGFPILRPDTDLASDGSIQSIHIQTTSGDLDTVSEVAIDYKSGIVETLLLAPAAADEDPAGYFAVQVEQNEGRSVQTVNGVPALVIERNVDGTGNPAVVSFVINGTQVTLYGLYTPIESESLVQVAESISIKG